MNLSEDEIIQKSAKHCGHCKRNTLLPHEYEFTCFSCGFNVNKRKPELSNIQRKKNKFCQSIEICRTKNILYLYRCI